MLFFRSEEHVRQWCEAQGEPLRPVLTIPKLWDLSVHWYGRKLDRDFERPGTDEVRALFTSLGLTDSFWEPDPGAERGDAEA
jgi:hypothetical protein